ncbi:hypothetical protein GCM10010124_18410 [Pilimelia terevasa]|uniref:Transglutaminase-like domain-containing protein n=1 Tax=Pilimelia terevasa TaxID=53372 RepID=A0A8J3BQH7_9ACTN|nr:DUF3488 and transglutaminase-like domain-containing protein [Pilimelia terevasa]GGK26116.1 hypothetical protein GCM10010124_18410 [Pilimelia terevasa]
MSAPRRLSVVAGAATLLGAAPLWSLFATPSWAFHALVAVALTAAASALATRLGGAWWLRVPLLLAGLAVALTLLFPSGGELLRVLPTADTLRGFAALAAAVPEALRTHAIAVPDLPPLLLLSTAGVGATAVLVDLLAVGLRRPALAGLPLLVVYAVPVAIHADSAPRAPFAVGALGFLWLLVADNLSRVRAFGRRFRGDGSSVDAWEPSPLGASARRLGVVGVAAAVLVPLAVPGLSVGVLSPRAAGPGAGRGSGRAVDLFADLSGRLNQPQVEELARFRTTDPDPGYLRFAVADALDEQGFRAAGWSGLPIDQATLPVSHGEERYRAQVTLSKRFSMRMLPVYQGLARTDLDGAWQYDAERGTVFSTVASGAGRRYEFGFTREAPEARQLRRVPPLAPDDPLRRWTEVPRNDRVAQLVADLTRGARTDYDKVDRLRRHFDPANGYRYDLRTEPGTTGAAITDFLDRKVGFCQQYAAALAWLARAAGVPARVAIGFTLGNDNRDGERILTNRNLHAWTEIFFPDAGWLPFDATPPASIVGGVSPRYAPRDVDVSPTRPAPGSDSGAGPAGPAPTGAPDRRPGRDIDAGAPGAAPAAAGGDRRSWLWLLALPLLAVAALPALRRRQVRRRRVAAPRAGRAGGAARLGGRPAWEPEDGWRARAHAAWAELTDTLADYRVPAGGNDTPRQQADRVAVDLALPAAARAQVRELAAAEERARYARTAGGAGDPAAALRAVRQACAARASRLDRVAAVVLPRSVLRRTRAALDGRAARAREAVDRWRGEGGRGGDLRLGDASAARDG